MKASDPYHPTLVKPETGDMFGGDGLTTRQRYIMAAMQGLCAGFVSAMKERILRAVETDRAVEAARWAAVTQEK